VFAASEWMADFAGSLIAVSLIVVSVR
jgi:hypothetical protein